MAQAALKERKSAAIIHFIMTQKVTKYEEGKIISLNS